MNTNALLIGLLIGIPFGLYVSLVSNRHQKVMGGTLAQIFHVLGAMSICSAPPTTLATVFSGGGLLWALVTAFSLIGLGLLFLLVHAVFERPALERAAQVEDRGWTAEKAKSSGL